MNDPEPGTVVSDLGTVPGSGSGMVSSETPQIIIITGMSGAGRTQVAKILEDLGTYVIDNLPPALLGKVVDLAFGPGSSVDRLALVADVRGREFFSELVNTIRELRQSRASVRLVFLEASDETLVQRYEEHRRRHPADDGGGLLDAIENERDLLSELRGMADLVIDTTDLNVHELRDRVMEAMGEDEAANLHVQVVSFGFKHGTPRDADLVMDVRFLPNPHWVDELRPYTGRDEQVRDFVLEHETTKPFLDKFKALLDTVMPGYIEEGKRYLTIAIGCTGGRHRSVTIAEDVGRYLRETGETPVTVEHRDLEDA